MRHGELWKTHNTIKQDYLPICGILFSFKSCIFPLLQLCCYFSHRRITFICNCNTTEAILKFNTKHMQIKLQQSFTESTQPL